MVGSYRCHCDGNVDEQTGNCVPGSQIATTELPFKPVTVADDGKQLKALSHGAIFLATCNASLLLRDVN